MRSAIIGLTTLLLAGCGTALDGDARPSAQPDAAKRGLAQVIAESFRPRGQAGLDRLKQSGMQELCSRDGPEQLPAQVQQALQAEALAGVRYPQDGRWLGDWQRGERIAQSSTGLQYSDPPEAPRGGGCYGCHRLSGTEIAYGTIGPSLYRYLERSGGSGES